MLAEYPHREVYGWLPANAESILDVQPAATRMPRGGILSRGKEKRGANMTLRVILTFAALSMAACSNAPDTNASSGTNFAKFLASAPVTEFICDAKRCSCDPNQSDENHPHTCKGMATACKALGSDVVICKHPTDPKQGSSCSCEF